MPDTNGNLSDDERMYLYTKCQANRDFDVLGTVNVLAGVLGPDPAAVL
jgi:hypothetical protein